MLDRIDQQRTYVLVGCSGTGKTSIGEMILFNTGVTNRMGKIESGNTVLDYEPEEVKKGGSIQAAFAVYTWQKARHFLIDTPGDPNFQGELPYQVLAADGIVYVLDAANGVRPQDRKLWRDVSEFRLPTIVVVNKMDRERADFDKAIDGLKEILKIKPAVLFYPIGKEDDFRGVVDVLKKKALFFKDNKVETGEIPSDLVDKIEEIYEMTVENIAENDEELMEKYLEGEEIKEEEFLKGLRSAVLKGELCAVLPISATSNKGALQLLSTIQNLFPSPLERAPWIGADDKELVPSVDGPMAAFVCKTLTTPFGSQLSVLRVLSGVFKSDMQVLNATKDTKEKIGQIQWIIGKNQEPCKEEVGPGAIVCIAKLKSLSTGDTISSEKEKFMLKLPPLQPQLISFAVKAATKEDEDKIMTALQKLLDEDVSLKLEYNEDTKEMLLSGMGQMHIEMAVEKLRRRNKVEVKLQSPKIPYKETIVGTAEAQGKYKKQTGGRGQYGDCWIRISPKKRGEGYEFVNKIVGGVIPKQYIPAVDQGIREAAQKGVLAGFPVIDFKVELYDGSYHSVDSSDLAFKIAGSLAFKKAAEKAGVTLLEPIMKVVISVPDEYMGDIIGDLSSRRGKVLGYETKEGITEIQALVPLAEILQYASDLTSMTGGQGVFTMEFSHYEECPPQVKEKVLAEVQAQKEEG